MVATIKSIDEPYGLVFEHLGEVVGGVEDTTSERVKTWAGSLEEYYLTEQNGITTLRASVQIPDGDEGEEIMNLGFTAGLEVVKRLAEQENSASERHYAMAFKTSALQSLPV